MGVYIRLGSKEMLEVKDQGTQTDTFREKAEGPGMVVEQSERQFVFSSKSGQVHLVFESKRTLESERQQPQAEASRNTDAMRENSDNGMSVNQSQVLASSRAGQIHLKNEETFHQQLQSKTSNRAEITKKDEGKMIMDQTQEHLMPSNKVGQIYLKCKSTKT